MYDEVHGAYDDGSDEERGNGLYNNASMKKVNVSGDYREKPDDDAIHDDDANAEREHDDGAEHEREHWFQNKV